MPKGNWSEAQKGVVSGRRSVDQSGNDLGRISASGEAVSLAQELAAQYVSTHTRAWIPGDQGAGSALDLSGNGAHLVPVGTMTVGELWAAANKMSWPGGTGKYAEIASPAISIDALTTSILFSIRLNKATPAGSEFFLGRGYLNCWLQIGADNTGKGYFSMRGGASEESFTFATINGVFNGVEKHLVYAWDHATKTGFLFMDKVLVWSGAVALTKSTYNTGSMTFGVVSSPGAGATCYTLAARDIYLATPPSILSTPLQRIVRKLYNTPNISLQDADFIA